MDSFTFLIKYTLESDPSDPHRGLDPHKFHVRRYHALSESIALEMFKETVGSGSLTGEKPHIVSIRKLVSEGRPEPPDLGVRRR